MKERERQELKRFREQFEAEERQRQEEKERPIREAETKLQETANQLAVVKRENLLSIPDEEKYVDPSTIGKNMAWQDARKLAIESSEKFKSNHPEYHSTPENAEVFVRYFQANGLNILTTSMIEAAYVKLRDAGLFKELPEPEPEPTPEPDPLVIEEQPVSRNSRGYDLQTGELREYTPYEVECMSADQFRRVFSLRNSQSLLIDPVTRKEASSK